MLKKRMVVEGTWNICCWALVDRLCLWNSVELVFLCTFCRRKGFGLRYGEFLDDLGGERNNTPIKYPIGYSSNIRLDLTSNMWGKDFEQL